MNIVIINPMLRTAEKGVIPQCKTIKDSLLYNYTLAFYNLGHNVSLLAAKEYMPSESEEYPYPVIFLESNLKWLFKPHLIPLHLELFKYLLHNKDKIDLVISSEVFQLNSLITALCIDKKKIIFWQEMSNHQKKMIFKLFSLIWYNFVARLFMKNILVVPRSKRAYFFTKNYLTHLSQTIVGHGISSEKFTVNTKKEDYLISVARLVPGKNIGSLIKKFDEFIKSSERFSHYKLLIVGGGDQLDNLIFLTNQLNIKDSVIFCGQISHNEINNFLGKSKCLLIDTLKDNVALIVSEAIATGTPILSNSVIDNDYVINDHNLGIAKNDWNYLDIVKVIDNNDEYVENCIKYCDKLSFDYYAKLMLSIFNEENKSTPP